MGAKIKKISIKYRILFIVLMVQVPFLVLFRIYIGYTTDKINLQMARGYTEALQVFCNEIETQLSAADAFLGKECWGSYEFCQISEAASLEEAEIQIRTLLDKTKSLLDNNVDISGVSFCFDRMDREYTMYSSYASFSEYEQDRINKMIKELQRDGSIINTGWTCIDDSANTYLIRIFRSGGGYCTIFFDLQRISSKSQTYYKMSTPVVFMKNGKLITQAHWTGSYQGKLDERGFEQGYQMISCEKEKYIVVPKHIMTMTALYGVRYNYQWDWLNIVIYLFITIFILSFAFAWLSLHFSFFKPLKKLLSVMNSVRAGNLTARAEGPKDKEFSIINETFNSMLDTIEHLKIETYENQLRARNAEMNALRLQIRKHFFLNCLKNIYAMAHSGDVKDIKEAVLLLSNHLRYTLNISIDAVSLQVELDMCRNYIELQGVGQDHKPQLVLNTDDKIMSVKVPPISILTLVENCCKYGVMQDRVLTVTIDASVRTFNEDKFVYIVVKDNGPGFSENILQFLNSDISRLAVDGHVGINNVMTRMKMMYGNDCSMIFDNADGACIYIIIPVKEDDYETVNSR